MASEVNHTETSPVLSTQNDSDPASKAFTVIDDMTTVSTPKKQKIDHTPDTPNLITLTTTTSATVRALALPELLELILRHLDALALCRLFRTSKYILTTITTSIHLRRRLWWQPNPTLSAYLVRAPTFLNPHLLSAKAAGRLPIKTFMPWPTKDGHLHVQIHFSSVRNLRRMCAEVLATWRMMVVRQPYDEGTVWSLGVCEDGCQRWGHRCVGVKCEGLREAQFRVVGVVPTLGFLVDGLEEKLGLDVGGEGVGRAEKGVEG
ncbi:hypothetical protein Tdes44962_MAKER06026 [Teratosphaeria destructans]|uniref:F-box domain-containing protein n=1 Tax=Teratosphaeria destructans TaxID=418781 RepID=A0A9W7SIE0_9PEZI|nr:hypothetical protein Tdes44962_MAKER06026 [Teratosphaeria destructans]